MKTITKGSWLGLMILVLCLLTPMPEMIYAGTANSNLRKKRFTVNFENTDIRDALLLIAAQGSLRLDIPEDVKGAVNYSFSNVTLSAALDEVCAQKKLSCQITNGGVLSVGKGWSDVGASRGVASVGDSALSGGAQVIRLKYLTASDALKKVSTLLSKDDKVIEDKPTNSLAFFGSANVFARIRDAIGLFDVMPQQILIEAHIVEINKNHSLDFGFSYGDLTDPKLLGVTKSSAVVSNKEPTESNFTIQLGLGKIDGSMLSARLAAAEVDGSAKVLSRPKVLTINNKPATINSGISYSVRTLAAVSTNSADTGDAAVASGVTQVKAGLDLSVTPTIVGKNKVKLLIDVSNSEPDESTRVDNIPGIISNSTTTEIIVGNGKTASVAGLVKNTFSDGQTGVPFLSRIPVLGWLFKSMGTSNRDKELMVFITPRIVKTASDSTNLDTVKEKFPEVNLAPKEAKLK